MRDETAKDFVSMLSFIFMKKLIERSTAYLLWLHCAEQPRSRLSTLEVCGFNFLRKSIDGL